MTRMWVCLARQNAHDEVRRTLIAHAPEANVVFVDSAGELRSWACDAAPGVHVAVGPLEEGSSSLNVAAAIVHDGGASEVVIVANRPDEDFMRRARLLGAAKVLDSSEVEMDDPADDLDEPEFLADDVPTLVMGAFPPERREALQAVPTIERVTGMVAPTREPTARASVAQREQRPSRESLSAPRVQPAHDTTPHVQLTSHRAEQAHTPIIALVSGRGGVGKTSVVAAMATAAASWGMRVAVCDLDLTCGNLFSCFGMDGPADLGALVLPNPPTPEELRACGRPAGERIQLWGPCERPEMADATSPHVERLLAALREASDLVLVDTGTTFTDATAQAAQSSDRLVIVVDGRPGSVAAQARLGGLAVRLGVARTRIARLANRCDRRGRGEPAINRAQVGLETARPLRVLDGGAEVAECLGEGKVRDLFALNSKFATSSAESLAKLLKELGCLPDVPQARQLVERRQTRSMWTFGRIKEAV